MVTLKSIYPLYNPLPIQQMKMTSSIPASNPPASSNDSSINKSTATSSASASASSNNETNSNKSDAKNESVDRMGTLHHDGGLLSNKGGAEVLSSKRIEGTGAGAEGAGVGKKVEDDADELTRKLQELHHVSTRLDEMLTPDSAAQQDDSDNNNKKNYTKDGNISSPRQPQYHHPLQQNMNKPRPLNVGDDMDHMGIQPTIIPSTQPYTYTSDHISEPRTYITHPSLQSSTVYQPTTSASYTSQQAQQLQHSAAQSISPYHGDPMSQQGYPSNPLQYYPSPVTTPLGAQSTGYAFLQQPAQPLGTTDATQTAVATANALATQSVSHALPQHLQPHPGQHVHRQHQPPPPQAASHGGVSPGMAGGAGNESLHAVAHLIRDNNNVVVKFLPSSFSQDSLYQLCSAFGDILSCRLIRDRNTGVSLGYGFVTFADDPAAAQAVNALNGLPIENKILRAAIARPITPAQINTPQQQQNTMFPTINPNTMSMSSAPGNVPPSSASKYSKANIYVAGLPRHYTVEDLNGLFGVYGTINESRILLDREGMSRGVGFVRYVDPDSATIAIQQLNGTQLASSDEQLIVRLARESAHQQQLLQSNTSANPLYRDQPYGSTYQNIRSRSSYDSNSMTPPVNVNVNPSAGSTLPPYATSPYGPMTPYNYQTLNTGPSPLISPLPSTGQYNTLHKPPHQASAAQMTAPYTQQHATQPQGTMHHTTGVTSVFQFPPRVASEQSATGVSSEVAQNTINSTQSTAGKDLSTSSRSTPQNNSTSPVPVSSTKTQPSVSTNTSSSMTGQSAGLASPSNNYPFPNTPTSALAAAVAQAATMTPVPTPTHQQQANANTYNANTGTGAGSQAHNFHSLHHTSQQGQGQGVGMKKNLSVSPDNDQQQGQGQGRGDSHSTGANNNNTNNNSVDLDSPRLEARRSFERSGVSLFVFHLPPDISDGELQQLFSSAGPVLSAKVMMDSDGMQSKGFGFVNFAAVEAAERAITTFNGRKLGNKFLKVSFKRSGSQSQDSMMMMNPVLNHNNNNNNNNGNHNNGNGNGNSAAQSQSAGRR
jgi:RNA recognition motif-containing protein